MIRNVEYKIDRPNYLHHKNVSDMWQIKSCIIISTLKHSRSNYKRSTSHFARLHNHLNTSTLPLISGQKIQGKTTSNVFNGASIYYAHFLYSNNELLELQTAMDIYCFDFTVYLLKVKNYGLAYIMYWDAEWDISLYDASNTTQQSITKYTYAIFYLNN